jgi:hypothetical protein
MANPFFFTGVTSNGALVVKETDGNPNVPNVNTIVVSNGTLTNDGGGVVTITTGGGGAGVDSWAGGTTGLLPSGATTGVVSISGTLVVANGGTGATTLTDNSVLTGAGTSAIIAEGNLTFDGTTGILTTTGFSCTGDASIGDAADDDIGFFDVTGVVQRTTSNASSASFAPGIPAGPLDQADTFGGYSLGQIVGALQDLGLLE